MPVTFKDISKKAEVSHMLGIITYRVADSFYNEVQGGFENMAHSLMIGASFFTSAHENEVGKGAPTVVIHHRVAEVLLHSIYHDDVNAGRIDVAFT